MADLKDVQSEKDRRNIPINKVGIRDLSYPVSVQDKNHQVQHTIARINMYVDLPHHYRGTHMSRFPEVMSRHNVNLGLHNLEELLDDMKQTFDCETSHIELEFPYFVKRQAPISGMESLMEYPTKISASKGTKMELLVQVSVPVHNLCPCSKEISSEGAHNQRGIITISIRSSKLVWFEELIVIAEESASTPLYALLKREDEKFVTEKAYQNPRFVEDAAREVCLKLNKDTRIDWYSVEVTNFESIHNHNAYAYIEKTI